MGLALHAPSAIACGPVGADVRALLPVESATEVPVNAALIASATLVTDVAFTLRKVATPNVVSDAGSEEAPLEVECVATEAVGTSNGAVCVARGELEPDTEYEWSAALLVSEEEEVQQIPSGDAWHSFRTGKERVDAGVPDLEAVLVQNERILNSPCGDTSSATVEFDGSTLTQPVVANFRGFTPGYVMHAVAVEPGANSEMLLWNMPDCAVIDVFDVTGERSELRQMCFDEELPPAGGEAAPTDPDAPQEPGPDAAGTDRPADDQATPDPDIPATDTTSDAEDDSLVVDRGVVTRGVGDDESNGGCSVGRIPRSSRDRTTGWALLALAGLVCRRRRGEAA